MRASLADKEAIIFVSIYQDIRQSIEDYKVDKSFAWCCVRPAILFAMIDNQAMRLGRCLESLVVIGIAATTVLNSVDIIEEMNHLMKHRRADVFNRSC